MGPSCPSGRKSTILLEIVAVALHLPEGTLFMSDSIHTVKSSESVEATLV